MIHCANFGHRVTYALYPYTHVCTDIQTHTIMLTSIKNLRTSIYTRVFAYMHMNLHIYTSQGFTDMNMFIETYKNIRPCAHSEPGTIRLVCNLLYLK